MQFCDSTDLTDVINFLVDVFIHHCAGGDRIPTQHCQVGVDDGGHSSVSGTSVVTSHLAAVLQAASHTYPLSPSPSHHSLTQGDFSLFLVSFPILSSSSYLSSPISGKHICVCISLIQIIGVLFQDIHGQLWEEEVVREKVEEEGKQTTRVYFINRKIKYFWDDSTCTFVKLRLAYCISLNISLTYMICKVL